MNFITIIFYILAIILIFSAFRVITTKNPINAALYLILAFIDVAMLFILLESDFLALLLILIYIGAVMVLFLFILMMLDIRHSNVVNGFKTNLLIAVFIGLIMILEISSVYLTIWHNSRDLSIVAVDNYNNIHAIGYLMYTKYIFAVEISAAILLVGIVSVISLTIKNSHNTKYNDSSIAVKTKAHDRIRMIKFPIEQDDVSK